MAEGSPSSRRVVVYGLQRSGTTWIAHVIDHLDRARCTGEIFHEDPSWPDTYHALARRRFSPVRRALRPVRCHVDFLADALAPDPGLDIVGVKIMYSHLGWPSGPIGRITRRWPQLGPWLLMRSMRRWLIDHEVTVIAVERRNVLKLRVSELLAWQTRVYHSTDGPRSTTSVWVDPTTIVKVLDRTSRRQQAARRALAGCRIVDLVYEDSEAAKRQALSRALGLEDLASLDSDLEKVTTDDLRHSISNYDEVATALTGTPFEWCLDPMI